MAIQPIEQVQKENTDLKTLQQISFETTKVADPQTLQEYINIAKMLAASGFYPDAKTAQQAVALMILGRHFGLSAVQSLTSIHIVKGKPMLHYSAILAKVREHPDYDYRIKTHSDKECTIEFFHCGNPCGTSTFTEADARKQGTQNMDKHAKTMLLARAASNGVKWYCPDVLNGMPVYVQGEIPEDEAHADAGISRRDLLKAELQAKVDPGAVVVAESEELPADEPTATHVDMSEEAWTVFGDPVDTQLRTMGMPHQEAADWESAGWTAQRMKLALSSAKDDLAKLRETLQGDK